MVSTKNQTITSVITEYCTNMIDELSVLLRNPRIMARLNCDERDLLMEQSNSLLYYYVITNYYIITSWATSYIYNILMLSKLINKIITLSIISASYARAFERLS